jgi:hypothetical protein
MPSLKPAAKKWLDNLQSILWSIRTTATKPTGETPFFLVYGAEAVLPTDVKFGSPRVLAFNGIRQEDLIKDRSSNSKKLGAKQRFAPRGTSKDYAATIVAMFGQGLWRSAIWCWGGYSLARAYTSCLQCGKAPSR